MKHFFSALLMVLFATSMMAQSGLSCDDPIPVDKNYKGKVDGPCELWYTANTYDLPLHVYFSPDSAGSEWSPEVYVDFTCEPGVYEDSKLDSLLNKMSIFGVGLPMEFMCDGVFRNGKQEWDLSISKSYREQLAESGITYNVKALVRVVYFESGSISLTPDTTFTSCMDNEYIKLGDTIDILPNDTGRVFVMPYTDWQNDSIQFVWVGEQEADVWLAVQSCEFTPNFTSSFVWDSYHLAAEAPHKLQQQQIVDIITERKNGGVYYGKVLSSAAGKLLVEKIPMAPIKGGATLLEYNKAVEVTSADQLFCFPRTWKATELVSTANKAVTMYMAATPDFTPSATDANVIAYHEFSSEMGQYHDYMSNAEMKQLLGMLADDYVYVRFQCATATSITPQVWDASSCTNNSLMIRPNQTIAVAAKSQSTIYRMRYDDWKNGDVVVEWSGNSTLPTYIADTCSFVVSATSPRVIKYANIKRKGTLDLDAATIESWAPRVDADGYLYVCFNPTNKGNVTFKLTKTVLDPVYSTIDATLCYGEVYEWNGQTYSTTGEYTQNFTTVTGADSTVTLNLTILPEVLPTTEEATIRYDELPYQWNDSAFTESTVYTVTLQDKHGCDSVVTLKLTVLEKSDIKTTDDVALTLQSAFKVYTMDHADWVAQSVVLHWQGASPLHIFVAKEEVHNLTPYNRHVLHYEMIPAGEEWILTKEQMAAWEAEATAAGGKLYVRFLTEKEGRLTTVPMD